MARADTANYEQIILEVETDTPGTYASICGMIDVTITRTANVDTSEVPDCDDASLPLSVERQVRSIEVTASGTGVYAQQSSKTLMDWFYSSTTKNVRLRNAKATADGATGDTEIEAGPALLTSLGNEASKGNKIQADISIEFDGVPTRTLIA